MGLRSGIRGRGFTGKGTSNLSSLPGSGMPYTGQAPWMRNQRLQPSNLYPQTSRYVQHPHTCGGTSLPHTCEQPNGPPNSSGFSGNYPQSNPHTGPGYGYGGNPYSGHRHPWGGRNCKHNPLNQSAKCSSAPAPSANQTTTGAGQTPKVAPSETVETGDDTTAKTEKDTTQAADTTKPAESKDGASTVQSGKPATTANTQMSWWSWVNYVKSCLTTPSDLPNPPPASTTNPPVPSDTGAKKPPASNPPPKPDTAKSDETKPPDSTKDGTQERKPPPKPVPPGPSDDSEPESESKDGVERETAPSGDSANPNGSGADKSNGRTDEETHSNLSGRSDAWTGSRSTLPPTRHTGLTTNLSKYYDTYSKGSGVGSSGKFSTPLSEISAQTGTTYKLATDFLGSEINSLMTAADRELSEYNSRPNPSYYYSTNAVDAQCQAHTLYKSAYEWRQAREASEWAETAGKTGNKSHWWQWKKSRTADSTNPGSSAG